MSTKIDHNIGSFSLARSDSKPGDWKVREEVLMLIKRSTDDYQWSFPRIVDTAKNLYDRGGGVYGGKVPSFQP
jgi:hypothetical protein